MRNKMNMKNKMHKCAPTNSQINLSAQEWEAKSEIARLLAVKQFLVRSEL